MALALTARFGTVTGELYGLVKVTLTNRTPPRVFTVQSRASRNFLRTAARTFELNRISLPILKG